MPMNKKKTLSEKDERGTPQPANPQHIFHPVQLKQLISPSWGRQLNLTWDMKVKFCVKLSKVKFCVN